jgi:hypothetical protein
MERIDSPDEKTRREYCAVPGMRLRTLVMVEVKTNSRPLAARRGCWTGRDGYRSGLAIWAFARLLFDRR